MKFGQVAPWVAIGGSGAVHLSPDQKWARELVKIVKAHDRGRLSPQKVAAHLARLNYKVHLKDNSVGPRCIVAWRLQQGGGSHELFSGLDYESSPTTLRLPTIANGMDINDIVQVSMPHVMAMFEAMSQGESKELDKDTINAELAHLPNGPDERLD